MERGIEFLRNLVHSSTNRISFLTAIRGVTATATPFIVLRLLGFPVEAVFATFAGLNITIANSGGPYRTRLRTMGLIVLIMPVVIFAGTQVRSSWWLATLLMFLIAFIILLLDLVAPTPWQDIVERIRDTLIGAGFGLVVGYLLWPVWERHRLPEQIAAALDANRAYLSTVLRALANGPGSEDAVHSCRRQAEIATGNAEVAFQRMLDEPEHQRAHEAFFLTLITYIRSLNQHATRLAVYQQELSQALPELQPLVERLDGTLEEVAQAVSSDCPAGPPPSTDEIFAPIHAALSEKKPPPGNQPGFPATGSQAATNGLWVAFDHLLDQIVGDVNSMHAATLLKE